MSGGILLAVAGIWVLSQVLGGNALGRLGITGAPTEAGAPAPSSSSLAPGPTTGIPYLGP